MISRSTSAPTSSRPRITPLWRRVWLRCAAALVLLLLLQPLLCVAHCVMQTHSPLSAEGRAMIGDPFICHLSNTQSHNSQLIPAFWPGVLPGLAILVIACTLWFRLSLAGPSRLTPSIWAPPIPPPRLPCAA